ncbi:MAG: hypothetical protein OXQ29_21435 [Rhodospirillaceae bacterium]|nr:hypothetical protein [Rhodospirillaceae bacterium]
MNDAAGTGHSLFEMGEDFEAITALHQRNLYARPAGEVAEFRLRLLQARFDALKERVGALRKLAGIQGVSAIRDLDDAVPVLFQHTVYKSYPMSLLERGRFSAMTRWLDQLTVHDLSAVDTSACTLIEHWLKALDRQTPLRCNHTTGTTGKLSFLPRTAREWRMQTRILMSGFQGIGGERDFSFDLDRPGFRVPIIQPSYRYGFYMAHRNMEEQIRLLGDPEKVECLYGDEMLSPDVLSLAGRVAAADARGELDRLDVQPELLERFKDSQAKMADGADRQARFFDRIFSSYRGQQVLMGNAVPQLYQMAVELRERGVEKVFSEDSMVISGGGLKGLDIPPDWREIIERALGAKLLLQYGMSELCVSAPMCPRGNYHVPPYMILYLLDEQTGEPLPRTGLATGRAAMFDPVPDTYWGGFVTGDEITVNWDGGCACGRNGEYILPDIRRFSDRTGQEDKISCAGAQDAQERAMEFLANEAARV